MMPAEHVEQTLEDVLAFIRAYIHENGFSPSLREIADSCYLGRSTALRYLDKLEARGAITRTMGKARSITLRDSKHP